VEGLVAELNSNRVTVRERRRAAVRTQAKRMRRVRPRASRSADRHSDDRGLDAAAAALESGANAWPPPGGS